MDSGGPWKHTLGARAIRGRSMGKLMKSSGGLILPMALAGQSREVRVVDRALRGWVSAIIRQEVRDSRRTLAIIFCDGRAVNVSWLLDLDPIR